MNDSTYSVNIERVFLNSILFDYELFETLCVKADDFYFPAHQIVFSTMEKLYKNGLPLDEEFLRKNIDSKDCDDNTLLEILSSTPITDVRAYELQIIEDSKLRKLSSLANTIKKESLEDDKNSSDVIDNVRKELNVIEGTDLNSRTTSDIVDAFIKDFQIAAQNNGPIGLRTSLKKLNYKIGAFAPGDLVVIGARPSMGKTSLAVNLANDFRKKGNGILFDSLEMGGEKIIQRFLACENQEDLSDLKKGLVKDYSKYHDTLKSIATDKNFLLHDKSGLTFAQLCAKARKILRQNKNIKAWFIDHVGYIKTNTITKRQEMGDGTKEIKKIAKEFGVTVFLLSQLNREITNRKSFRPQLSDLKESGNLEEDADIVIFPHRESYYKRAERSQIEAPVNEAELIIVKNRDGMTGIVPCKFNGPTNSFLNDDIPIEVTFQSNEDYNSNVDASAFPAL